MLDTILIDRRHDIAVGDSLVLASPSLVSVRLLQGLLDRIRRMLHNHDLRGVVHFVTFEPDIKVIKSLYAGLCSTGSCAARDVQRRLRRHVIHQTLHQIEVWSFAAFHVV